MTPYIYATLSVFLVSLISLVGLFTLSINEKLLRKYVFCLVSLAVGALLGDAFIHLLPESFSLNSSLGVSMGVILGIFIFLIVEKLVHWHHHEGIEDKEHHPVGFLIVVSDGLHNFIDGLLIGVSYLVSIEVGMATTIAVILHEIPQEIGDFGVLLHAGYTKTRALWLNFLSALFAVVGVLISFLIGEFSQTLSSWLLPVAAGGFIYIALSDLLPDLQKTRSLKFSIIQIFSILIGVGLMVLLLTIG